METPLEIFAVWKMLFVLIVSLSSVSDPLGVIYMFSNTLFTPPMQVYR